MFATLVALRAATALAIDDSHVLLLVGVALAASSVRVSLAVAAGVGAIAWALYTGFVVHQYGELSLGVADLARAGVLVAAGVLTAAVTGHQLSRSLSLR